MKQIILPRKEVTINAEYVATSADILVVSPINIGLVKFFQDAYSIVWRIGGEGAPYSTLIELMEMYQNSKFYLLDSFGRD